MVYAVFPSVSNRDGTKRFHYVMTLSSRFQRTNEILTQTSIINTLAIGVYFSIISSLDTGYWDGLETALTSAGCGNKFNNLYYTTRNVIVAGITCGCIAVIITFLYYFKPPQEAQNCVVIKVNGFPVVDDRLVGVMSQNREAITPSVDGPNNPINSNATIELKNRTKCEHPQDFCDDACDKNGRNCRDSVLNPLVRQEFETAWEEFTADYIEYLEAMGYIAVFSTYVSIVCFMFAMWELFQHYSVPSKFLCTQANSSSTTTASIIFGAIACLSLCAMKIGYGTELFPRWAERVGLKTTSYYRFINFVVYALIHFAFFFTPIFVGLYLSL